MTDTKTTTTLHDSPVPVRAKLAAAWTSFMFLYIYVDYLHLYKPGALDRHPGRRRLGVRHQPDLCRLCAHERGDPDPHDPALHDAARPCQPRSEPRRGNALHPLLGVQPGGGEWLVFYGLGVVLEVLLLAFVLRSAWTWPRTSSAPAPEPAAQLRSQIQMGR